MHVAVIGLLGLQVAFAAFDLFRFHDARTDAERSWWKSDSFSLVTLAAVVVFREAGGFTTWMFGIFALELLLLRGRAAWLGAGRVVSASEAYLQTWLTIFAVLTLLTLGALWQLVHGVNIFLGAVLPFSTSGLREIVMGFGIAHLALMIVGWKKGSGRVPASAAGIEVGGSTETPPRDGNTH